MKKPELLAPVGNMEKLKMALAYGADAVYFGGKAFGLRAFSGNFSDEQLKEAIQYTHEQGKKAYVTVNAFPHNEDLPSLPDYLKFLRQISADAVIIADLGVYRILRDTVPDLPFHVSTQANSTNWSTVAMWEELGAERVVLAREVSLNDIRLIREKCSLELEAFVHGAMCISYSGRCLLSNYFTGRDANRGACAQACRWKYSLVEETRPGEYYPIAEDELGTYIFNSKDLCLLPYMGELMDAGIDSFKVEGRMKSVHYVATVMQVYRQAMDAYLADPKGFSVDPVWLQELQKVSHREYTTGFYYHKADANDQIYGSSSYWQTHDFVGLVRQYDPQTGWAVVEQRNNMKVGQEIEVLSPGGKPFIQVITEMKNDEGEAIDTAPHPQQIVTMPMAQPVKPLAMLRREVKSHG